TADGGAIRVPVSQTASLSNLVNTGTLVADNNSNTNISGTITNNGSMTIYAGGSYTDVVLNGDTLLTGNGALTLSTVDPNASNARVRGGGKLTNDIDHTIEGRGN